MSRARRLAGLAVLGTLLVIRPASAGEPVEVLDAQLTPGEGGSATEFTLTLPAGASCPGDSANDGYRVNSYMVPSSVDPATITFDGLGPTPNVYGRYDDFRQPLYDTDTNSFVAIQTADATAPGEPGAILPLPGFDYAVYSPGDLPAGRYHVGVMCTLLKDIITVWDTEVVVTEAADDEPAQIRWAAVETSDGDASTSAGGIAPFVVGGLALLTGVVLMRRRRAVPASTTTTSLEDP